MVPIIWYEADIVADAIVSLAWLATWRMDVRSREHGIMIKSTDKAIWVKGIKAHSKVRFQEGFHVQTIDTTRMGQAQMPKMSQVTTPEED